MSKTVKKAAFVLAVLVVVGFTAHPVAADQCGMQALSCKAQCTYQWKVCTVSITPTPSQIEGCTAKQELCEETCTLLVEMCHSGFPVY